MGLISSKPGRGPAAGRSSSVMVSPMRVSETRLMLAIAKPTSPACRLSTRTGLGVRTPSSSTVYTCPFDQRDRKSTRLNSSHVRISYAVFCLKKKKDTDDVKLNDIERSC